ncbi:MAG TPA: DNA adenine methylase [Aquella sp.]|nr:DNA adenine methylase [Aquella sp.]
MSSYYSPLRYPGGKNCIFDFVLNLFRENAMLGTSYAEPYAGGAGLALRLLLKGYVEHIYINDFDRAIYAFWETVVKSPNELCKWIEEVNVSIDSWFYYREIYRNSSTNEILELAKATFFLNRTNISGVIKGGVIGGFQQSGKYKINARFNKADLIARIQNISNFKQCITVSNLDGIDFIKELENKNEDIFIYLDPPYYKKGAELYMNYFSKIDHMNLSEHVHRLKKKWMVSYDNHDFILKLYENKSRLTYKLAQNTSNRIGDEVLIFPDSMRFKDSMLKLKSPVLI